MKLLNGQELAGFIKERQAKQVRRLRQADGLRPKLAIVQTIDDPVINLYVRLKKRYGEDIGIEVEVHHTSSDAVGQLLTELNADEAVHGIIVQLPLDQPSQTKSVLNMVALEKDVDGLADQTPYDPATPTAILWLLSGYAIELQGKRIVIVGAGPLVGAPLSRMLENSQLKPIVVDRQTHDLAETVRQAEVIISAAGAPGLITSDMIAPNAVVIDAGTADANGKTVGDVAEELYLRENISITPQKGGVGPLTVCALFENVLKAAASNVKTD